MGYKGLDFELSDQLLLKFNPLSFILTSYLLLYKNFQSANESCLFMSLLYYFYIAKKTVPCFPLPNCRMILKWLILMLSLRLLGLKLSSVSLNSYYLYLVRAF